MTLSEFVFRSGDAHPAAGDFCGRVDSLDGSSADTHPSISEIADAAVEERRLSDGGGHFLRGGRVEERRRLRVGRLAAGGAAVAPRRR